MATIRQVVTGTTTFTANTASVTATISPALLDMTKSVIFFGKQPSSANANTGMVRARVTATNQITFNRNSATSAPALTMYWYVVEFTAGIVVRRGQITQTATTVNTTIPAVDPAKSFVLHTDQQTGTGYSNDEFSRLSLTTSTNIASVALVLNTSHLIEYQVVEYDNCTVQAGTFTLGTADSSITASCTGASQTKSILLFSYDSQNGTGTNIAQKMVRGVITNATTLTFDRGSTGQAITGNWSLVTFTDATTVQAVNVAMNASTTSVNSTITAVDTARTIVVCSGWMGHHGKTSYTTAANPSACSVTTVLTSSTQLTTTRSAALGTADITVYVVEFPSATTFAEGSGISRGEGKSHINSLVYSALTGNSPGIGRSQIESLAVMNNAGVSAGHGQTFGTGGTGVNLFAESFSRGLSQSFTDTLGVMMSTQGSTQGRGLNLSATQTVIGLSVISRGQSSSFTSTSASASNQGVSSGNSRSFIVTSLTSNLLAHSLGVGQNFSLPSVVITNAGVSRGFSFSSLIETFTNYLEAQGLSRAQATSYLDAARQLFSANGNSIGQSQSNSASQVISQLNGLSRGQGLEPTGVLSATFGLVGVSSGLGREDVVTIQIISTTGSSVGIGVESAALQLVRELLGYSTGLSRSFGDLELIEFELGLVTSVILRVAVKPSPKLVLAQSHPTVKIECRESHELGITVSPYPFLGVGIFSAPKVKIEVP